ncbi:MAG: TIGR02391 family protein [Sphingomonadales bacterium]
MVKQPDLRQAQLSKEQMQLAITKIDRRIAEMNSIEIDSITTRSDPRIGTLKAKLDKLLMSIFGADSIEYRRYRLKVTTLDTAPYYGMGETPLREVLAGLHKGFGASIAHLEGIKSGFIEDLEDLGIEPQATSETKPEAISMLAGLHPKIQEKCLQTFEAGAFAETVEKSFKIVRDKLRELTSYETGSEAFGKGNLHIKGAAAPNVDADFNQAVKFLLMSIDMFKNEKSHTSDSQIQDPIRARHYLTISSLAMFLLEKAEIKPKP